MAKSGTDTVSDTYPWAILTAPGSIYPQTIQAPQGNPGSGTPDDLGGVQPWGCDQQPQWPQDLV